MWLHGLASDSALVSAEAVNGVMVLRFGWFVIPTPLFSYVFNLRSEWPFKR
jgi:hypothetical protein